MKRFIILLAIGWLTLGFGAAEAQTGKLQTTYHEYQANGYQYRNGTICPLLLR